MRLSKLIIIFEVLVGVFPTRFKCKCGLNYVKDAIVLMVMFLAKWNMCLKVVKSDSALYRGIAWETNSLYRKEPARMLFILQRRCRGILLDSPNVIFIYSPPISLSWKFPLSDRPNSVGGVFIKLILRLDHEKES